MLLSDIQTITHPSTHSDIPALSINTTIAMGFLTVPIRMEKKVTEYSPWLLGWRKSRGLCKIMEWMENLVLGFVTSLASWLCASWHPGCVGKTRAAVWQLLGRLTGRHWSGCLLPSGDRGEGGIPSSPLSYRHEKVPEWSNGLNQILYNCSSLL